MVAPCIPSPTQDPAEVQGPMYLLPILIAGLLLRATMILSVARGDPWTWFYRHASELGCLAESMLAGRGLSSPFCGSTGPSAFLAPGYPAFVAMVFRCFGEYSAASAAAIIAMQTCFSLLTIVALMLVARREFGVRVANIAGALCALSPPLAWMPAVFWETALSTLFLAGALVAATYCTARPIPARWSAFGAYCGSAMLVNPALMFSLAATVIWAAWRVGRDAKRNLLLAIAAWVVVFAAWPIRNALVLHAFIPFRTNLGYELWQGNGPGSEGMFRPELHPNVNRQERSRYAALGEIAYMREKADRAMAAIEQDKPRFLRLTVERTLQFWTGYTEHNASFLVLYITAGTSTGFAGLVMLLRKRRRIGLLFAGPLLLFPLPYYLTHPDFRFRMLLDPMLLLLSAYAVDCWMTRAAERNATSRTNPVRSLMDSKKRTADNTFVATV